MNPKKQAEFWKEAALLREVAVQDNATYTAEEILKLYDEALEDIEVEIRKIENNYKKLIDVDDETAKYYLTQVQEDVSTAQLLQALEQAPDEKARRDILEYINSNERSTLAYAARRERYRAVEKEIYARIKVIAAKGIPLMGEMLKNAYKESYYGNIDDMAKGSNVGIRFSILNDRAINEAVNAKWSGKHFSKRLWDNTDKLAEESQKLVVKALMSGESLNKTADKLADKVQYVKYRNALGLKTMPSSFDKFQDLKYNDVERWKEIKALYREETKPYLQERLDYIYNGEKNFIPTGAVMTSARTIARKGSKTDLRVEDNLINAFGGQQDEWKKRVGKIESEKYIFDVHWYELNGKQYEAKVKYRGDKK